MAIRSGNMDEAAQNAMARQSLIALTIAVAGAVVLANIEAPLFARALLFVPFALAATWLLQAIGRT